MIQLNSLLESSFIALLEILIGTTLGIVLGWQALTMSRIRRASRHCGLLSLGG